MSSLKQVVRFTTIVLAVGAALAASFVGAFHDPRPHAMPVGVVAGAAQVVRLDAALSAHDPGALSLRRYRSAAAAAAAIRDRTLDGAVVLAPGHARLLVASAHAGSQTVATIQRAFTPASLRMPVATDDLAPLPASDRAGLTPFFFVLTLVIPSLLIGVLLTVATTGVPVRDRLLGAAAFAVALAAVDALLSNAAYAALGGYLQLLGLGALISFAASSLTIGLAALLGPLGLALSGILLLIVGVPASGAALGPAFIPGFYAALHPILPLGLGLDAVRNAVYFSGHATWGKVGLLGGWALLGLIAATISTRWSLPALLGRGGRSPAPAAISSDAAHARIA